MTDKSAAAVRKFAGKMFPLTTNEKFYNTLQKSYRKELVEFVTALIEEHYYPKEFVEWLLNGYTFLKSDQSFVVNYPYMTEHNDYRHFTCDELFNYWKENVR